MPYDFVRVISAVSPQETARMGSAELRAHYLADGLHAPGEIRLALWEPDRTVVGYAVPAGEPLALQAPAGLAAEFFCQRRELGIVNQGGAGSVTVDGVRWELAHGDAAYVGRGAREVVFASADASQPAAFALASYPAHASHPSRHLPASGAQAVRAGEASTANARTLRKFVAPGLCESAQLLMGTTRLDEGCVWNTWKPHRHARRTEAYFYLGLPAGGTVVHLLGEPDETRHVLVRDFQVALSPSWSIHSGCGTGAYSFAWAMGGENLDGADTVPVDPAGMR